MVMVMDGIYLTTSKASKDQHPTHPITIMYCSLTAILTLLTSCSLLVDKCLSFNPSLTISQRNDNSRSRILVVGSKTSLAVTSINNNEGTDAAVTATITTSTTPISRIGTLRVHGPDANGIVAAFSQILYGHGCGIVESEQHTDKSADLFFQRIRFDYGKMYTDRISIAHGIKEACSRFKMQHTLDWGDQRKRIAIMVSKYDHCLWELLLRHDSGELDCDIALIVSNHPDLQHIAESFKIPFHIFPVTKDTKQEVEEAELQLLQENKVDVVILARYMQIVSDHFCESIPVINIHHSFLPAFIGGKPYHRAHARGVKLIGATAHYATAVLDEGPIIEQDTTRISHRDAVDDLLRKGRILEKNVLVHAVQAHLQDRVIVYNNKCVVFDG